MDPIWKCLISAWEESSKKITLYMTKEVIHIYKQNVELTHSHEVNKLQSRYNNMIIFAHESMKYLY